MFEPVADMSEKYNIMQSAMASAERIFGIMDTAPDVTESRPVRAPGRARGPGRVRHVCFAYTEEQAGPPGRLLHRRARAGAWPSSARPARGRPRSSASSAASTIPTAGAILLDGSRPARDCRSSTLRENIAIVLQDAFIFSRTVEENIRLGAPDRAERVRRAAEHGAGRRFHRRGCPAATTRSWPSAGATLSTGQKQLICFARALAHDPRVLILDEATSSVDPATEQLIQKAIETLMRGRTSIIVAHRLSTIQKADEILVLDDGRIVERGQPPGAAGAARASTTTCTCCSTPGGNPGRNRYRPTSTARRQTG